MMIKVIKTDKATPPGGYYSQGIKVGDFLYTAGQIAYRLRNHDNLAIQIKTRKERNLRAVFKKELEPLFYA